MHIITYMYMYIVCMYVCSTRQGLFTSVAPQYTGHLIENKKMNYDLLMWIEKDRTYIMHEVYY